MLWRLIRHARTSLRLLRILLSRLGARARRALLRVLHLFFTPFRLLGRLALWLCQALLHPLLELLCWPLRLLLRPLWWLLLRLFRLLQGAAWLSGRLLRPLRKSLARMAGLLAPARKLSRRVRARVRAVSRRADFRTWGY